MEQSIELHAAVLVGFVQMNIHCKQEIHNLMVQTSEKNYSHLDELSSVPNLTSK